MRKYIVLFLFLFFFLLSPPYETISKIIPVYKITDQPSIITRGSHGSALTVNISFGDATVFKWIQQLEKPYPVLFIDMDWALRFPETIQLIIDKNIPVGLLGKEDRYYTDFKILEQQLHEFDTIFSAKPLWFRTKDERYSPELVDYLFAQEINVLSSTIQWNGKQIPSHIPGEIIAVPHTETTRVELQTIEKLSKGRIWLPIEEVLFHLSTKSKKFPPN